VATIAAIAAATPLPRLFSCSSSEPSCTAPTTDLPTFSIQLSRANAAWCVARPPVPTSYLSIHCRSSVSDGALDRLLLAPSVGAGVRAMGRGQRPGMPCGSGGREAGTYLAHDAMLL